MSMSGRNKGLFIGIEQEITFAIDHASHATDHNPVFATVMVHLQRQRLTRANHDALDLKARPFLKNAVSPPWTGHRTVQTIGVMAAALELLGNKLDLLAALSISNQQCIWRIDHNQVIQPNHANETPGGVDVTVMHVV